MIFNYTYNLNLDYIIYILNLVSFFPSWGIPLYLFSISILGLGLIPILFMSGKKMPGKIIDGLVKGATIAAGVASVEQSVRGRQSNNGGNNDNAGNNDNGNNDNAGNSGKGGNSQGKK